MSENSEADRLDQIEQRLMRIEAALGLQAGDHDEAVIAAETQQPRTAQPPPIAAAAGFAVESGARADATERRRAAGASFGTAADGCVGTGVAGRFARCRFRSAAKKKPARLEGTIEQTIGLKWAGWVGAVVLVIGAGLGIKFAYDQGWFGGMPPVVRLSIMCVAGFALLAAGEWVYRKVNVLSAVGLFGAGVAVLFLVSYSGHAYYGLYEPQHCGWRL